MFGTAGEPIIEVLKAAAGPVAEDPHRVDGLAGATMTSRGVTNLLRFWLADNGFGPFLERLRAESERRPPAGIARREAGETRRRSAGPVADRGL